MRNTDSRLYFEKYILKFQKKPETFCKSEVMKLYCFIWSYILYYSICLVLNFNHLKMHLSVLQQML